MRHITLLFLGSAAVAACASNPPPPAASSETIAEATTQPNHGPDFAPAANDGVATASSDVNRNRAETQPSPNLNPPSEQAKNGSQTSGTWGNGADGSSGVDPTTGNAAAAPADRSSQPAPPATGADNSRVNRRDRSGATLTPMDQGPSEADRKITRDIRQAVMGNSSLSFTAKNVKIITVDGKVTLRGPVKTDAERTAIEAAARKVVGNGALVESQLEVTQ